MGPGLPFPGQTPEVQTVPTERLRNLAEKERTVRQERRREGRHGVEESREDAWRYEWPRTETHTALTERCQADV